MYSLERTLCKACDFLDHMLHVVFLIIIWPSHKFNMKSLDFSSNEEINISTVHDKNINGDVAENSLTFPHVFCHPCPSNDNILFSAEL